jgi:hypothetical protein
MLRRTRKHKTRKHRGGFYSFQGAVGTGAPNWGRGSEMGDFNARQINSGAQYGRGRRRKSRGRKTRRMRGGGKFGATSASFVGTGSRGMIDVVGGTTKYPPYGGPQFGAFNNAGAQPGSGHASFDILPK